MPKSKLECFVPVEMKEHIDEIAARQGLRRGPCMRDLCRLALRNAEHPPMAYETEDKDDMIKVGVHVHKEWLDGTREYRARHRLVTNREFFFNALARGIALARADEQTMSEGGHVE